MFFSVNTSNRFNSLECGVSVTSSSSSSLTSIPSCLISVCMKRNRRSMSLQRRTSFTNLRWNSFTSGFNCVMEETTKKKRKEIERSFYFTFSFRNFQSDTYIAKLHGTHFAHFRHTIVQRFVSHNKLIQLHRFTAKQSLWVVDHLFGWLGNDVHRRWLQIGSRHICPIKIS